MQVHESGLQIGDVPLGYEKLVVSTVAVGLASLPNAQRLRKAVLRFAGQVVRWRDDGTNPTASEGMYAMEDEIIVYTGNLENIKFIRDAGASGDATLYVLYYGL